MAELFNGWIRFVIQAIDPWISSQDIDRGALWFREINSQLNEVSDGIVFLTHENKNQPWILFEAGALAKGLSSNRVCTFLIDLKPSDLQDPLAQFNHTIGEDGKSVFSLVKTLNKRLQSSSIDEHRLEQIFNKYWQDFETKFHEALSANPITEKPPEKPDREILVEILDSTRQLHHLIRLFEMNAERKVSSTTDEIKEVKNTLTEYLRWKHSESSDVEHKPIPEQSQTAPSSTSSSIKPVVSPINDQITLRNTDTPIIPFTVTYEGSSVEKLKIRAKSSDQKIVPDKLIFTGGSGRSRALIISPARNSYGRVTITLTAEDGNVVSEPRQFSLTITNVNNPPSISSIPDQETDQNSTLTGVEFDVEDQETAAPFLRVSASSSDTDLVPNDNILLSGGAAKRTLAIIPARNKKGTCKITLTVTDEDGAMASTNFSLTVHPVHQPPTIGRIANQTIVENGSLESMVLPVALGDSPKVTLRAKSSRPNLVPDGSIVFSEQEGRFTCSITPEKNMSGTATIKMVVTDDQEEFSSQSFKFTVIPVQKIS